MGRKVEVPGANVHYLIKQAYDAGAPYQWAREALVNSLQAKATWVDFGLDEESFTRHGIARRYVADNGIGMTEEQIQEFLSSFGGGGRPIGYGENFGQGFKASCYEWNRYGIVVMSWTPEHPDGVMIWIRFNEDDTTWELRDFEIYYEGSDTDTDDPDDISDCIQVQYNPELDIDLTKFHFEEIKKAGHGTVFLFLGDHDRQDTILGDHKQPDEMKSRRGVIEYLNTRFSDIPPEAKVQVSTLESKTEESERRDSKDHTIADPNGNRKTVHYRTVKGMKNFISPKHKTGVVNVKHNTRIRWYLTDEPDIKSRGGYGPSKPMISVVYQDEAYDRTSRPQDYRQFGITDAVKERVWLFIEPPEYTESDPTKWGVMPQASRGSLICKGSNKLPWDDWTAGFHASMPREIQQAIDEARAGKSDADPKDRRERLKRIQERLSTRFRPTKLVANPDGTVSGDDSGSRTGESRQTGAKRKRKTAVAVRGSRKPAPTGGAGDGVILIERKAGDLAGSDRRKSDGIPDVEWDETFYNPDALDESYAAARYDANETSGDSYGVVHMNQSFPMFQDEFEFWKNEWPRADPAEVEKTVKQVYEDEVVAKVMHAMRMKASTVGFAPDGTPLRVKDEQIRQWTSPEALTSGVIGLVNVEQRIKTICGARFGSGRTTQKKRK